MKSKKPQPGKLIAEFQQLVGVETYTAFLQIVKTIGPDARTHRMAVIFAAMLQYARRKVPDDCEEGSLGMALEILEDEPWEYDTQSDDSQMIFSLIDAICTKAKMRNKRVSARGQKYSIADQAITEYIAWYNYQWE